MPTRELTARFVQALKPAQREEHWDTIVRGLVLRAGPRSRSWSVVYTPEGGAKTRQAIGEFPVMTLEAARRRAKEIIGQVATGADPAEADRIDRAAMTVRDLAALFTEDSRAKRTWADEKRILEVNVTPIIGAIKITTLHRRDVRDVVERIAKDGKLRMASRTLAVTRRMLNWAVEKDYLEANPVLSLKAPAPDTKRDRVLGNGELAAFLRRLDDPKAPISWNMRLIFRLLALTGQRVGEVCGMTLEEVDLDEAQWLIPAARTKNGLPHIVPLSKQALAIIKLAASQKNGGPLFTVDTEPYESNAVSHALRRLYPKPNSVDWTPHDIRRTVATGMAGIKVAPHVVEAVLNHVSGHRAGVAGVYNRFSYADEKKAALELWADHVDTVFAKAAAKAKEAEAADAA